MNRHARHYTPHGRSQRRRRSVAFRIWVAVLITIAMVWPLWVGLWLALN